VAVALDGLGRRLGEPNVPTTAKGYQKLLRWAEGFGPVCCAGVEGTGSYGAGLARHLKAAGISVMEVERPRRRHRHLRRNGKKSDPIDAEAAARAVLADDTAGEPKSADGRVEMIRILRSARQSAVKARTPRPQTNCRLCWLAHRRTYAATVCASSLPRTWSTPVPVSAPEPVLM
jgi:transposase